MKLQKMICVVMLLFIFGISYGQQNNQPTQPKVAQQTTAPTKQTMDDYNEWSNNTELGLFFTYGYAVPYINYNDYTHMIGLDFNIVTPLSMCKYVALFHSFSNKFYGSFIQGNNLDPYTSPSHKKMYWDLSYTFGVRGYLGTRMVFVDAGIQAALLFIDSYGYNYSGPSMGYPTYGFQGVVGLGFDYPVQPNMSVQGSFHYVLPLFGVQNSSLRGFFFDLGLNWKI